MRFDDAKPRRIDGLPYHGTDLIDLVGCGHCQLKPTKRSGDRHVLDAHKNEIKVHEYCWSRCGCWRYRASYQELTVTDLVLLDVKVAVAPEEKHDPYPMVDLAMLVRFENRARDLLG